ncbi:MAG: glycosyltransferase family 9 protein [Pseudobacteriovorax sp.]|nr:glycosyltransferase family 9 protein [Pseudobacteriovorax sp.]
MSGNPDIDKLYTYNEAKGIGPQLSLLQQLRKRRYDVVVDFMYNPRSALFTYLSGAEKRVAFPSRRRWFYTHIVEQPKHPVYIAIEKQRLLAELGVDSDISQLYLPWTSEDTGVWQSFVKEHNLLDRRPIVCLSPTHRRPIRQWPGDCYARLADYLVRAKEAHVVWVWGPGENEFVSDIRDHCETKTHMAPKTSFAELAAFFANSDLFIGNSNGPSHVAVATNTPSIQLHGPTIGVTWCPDNQRHRFIQGESMVDITSQQVENAVEALWPEVLNNLGERKSIGVRMDWRPNQSKRQIGEIHHD